MKSTMNNLFALLPALVATSLSAIAQAPDWAPGPAIDQAIPWEPGPIWEVVSDLDGDGFQDLIVLDDKDYSPKRGVKFDPRPSIVVVSCRGGQVIWKAELPASELRVKGLHLAVVRPGADSESGGVSVLCVYSEVGAVPNAEGDLLRVAEFDPKSGELQEHYSLGVEFKSYSPLSRYMYVRSRRVGGRAAFRFLSTDSALLRSPIRMASGSEELQVERSMGIRVYEVSSAGRSVEYERLIADRGVVRSPAAWVDSVDEEPLCYSILMSDKDGVSPDLFIAVLEGAPFDGELHSYGRFGFKADRVPRVLCLGDVLGGDSADFAVVVPRSAVEGDDGGGVNAVAIVDGDAQLEPLFFFDHSAGGGDSFGCDLGGWRDCGFADSVELGGDLNGDGSTELLVGSLQANMAEGAVVVFDPKAAEVLRTVPAPSGSHLFGRRMRSVARAGAEGVPGLFVGEWWLERPQRLLPTITLWSAGDFNQVYSLP